MPGARGAEIMAKIKSVKKTKLTCRYCANRYLNKKAEAQDAERVAKLKSSALGVAKSIATSIGGVVLSFASKTLLGL